VLVGGGYIFLRKLAAAAEEEVIHLFDEELLGFAGPGLEAVLVEEHLLALHPLVPGFLADILVDFLSEVRVERWLVETLHFSFVSCAENHVRH
jgi:hypothetical protein